LSPEAVAAAAAFDTRSSFANVPSGQELIGWGFADDVELAQMIDADPVVPVLRNGRYIAADV